MIGDITMNRILTGTLIALMWAAVVHAQTAITGKWQGETKSGSQVALDLTATKTTLTGTITQNGQTLPIADGTVSKDTFTFNVTLGDRTEGFTGKLAGDEITVRIDRRGPESAAVLKRVKK